ncbi:MAG: phosphonate ABC transporter, permease protein PhnE [Fimbriimonadaceae bacterium]|nr:phosphonate ABC transporter, permease protein PhnE [Alphaproteobacteria bacterium]
MSDVPPPLRFSRPSPLGFVFTTLILALVISSFYTSGLSLEKLIRGLPSLARLGTQMFPPSSERLVPVFWSLLQTFQMAVAGTVLGLALSLPLAILASPSLSPHPIIVWAVRSLIALFRTVPDLVWAIVFVITVGLGPAAGVLALMIDTIGFAGRFFAEAMEETEKGPREALTAMGARQSGVIFSSVIPQAVPSMINTSLFSLEKATRGSVVLGLVGAGGIGIELKVSLELFDYDQAATIIIAIFLLVLIVERVSTWVRSRVL